MTTPARQAEYESANWNKWENSSGLYQKHLELYLDAMYALLKQTQAKSVLDAGCGEGVVYREMKKRGFDGEWVGLDLSKDAIDFAKTQSPEVTWIADSITNMPFESNSFDMAFSSQVLEHLAQPEEALFEMARCAKQWLLISVPYEPVFKWLTWVSVTLRIGGDPEHCNHWRPKDLQDFVSQVGTLHHSQITTVYQIALVKRYNNKH